MRRIYEIKYFKKLSTNRLTIFFALIFITKNSTNAATYAWPIGGNNSNETYIEYKYKPRDYDYEAYDKKWGGTAEEKIYVASENHYGVDITGKKGSSYDVVSVCNGKVIATSANRANNPSIAYATRNQRHTTGGLNDGGGYGNFVIVQDPSNGKCFLYAHLKANTISVKKGDSVTTNQKIGVMGSSGDSEHMHLHFEVRKNLAAVTTSGGQYFTKTTDYNVETEYKSSEGEGKLDDSVYYPIVVNNKDSDVIVTIKSKDNVKIQIVNNVTVPADGTKSKLGWYYPDKNDVTTVAKVYSLEDYNNETYNGNVTIYNSDNSSNIEQEIKVSFVEAKEEEDIDLGEDEALDNELAEDEKDSNEQEENKEEDTENKNSFIEKLPSILPNTGESIILIAIILISITVAIINKRKIKIK